MIFTTPPDAYPLNYIDMGLFNFHPDQQLITDD